MINKFKILKIAAIALAATLPTMAQAAITYQFAFNPGNDTQGSFSLTRPDPIIADVLISPSDLTSCITGYADTSCADQEFVIQSGGTRVGFGTVQLFDGDLWHYTSFTYFDLDAFTTNGVHNDHWGEATLTVSGIPEGWSAAVPEPASWALMIGGMGLAGATLRRRSSVRFATI